MRRATGSYAITVPFRHISIHALHEESDSCISRDYRTRVISIHALHEESDTGSPYFAMVQSVFQSTLSMRRATFDVPRRISAYRISIHALHEESDNISVPLIIATSISIHALHEESDRAYRIDLVHTVIISIHALHEESDAYH